MTRDVELVQRIKDMPAGREMDAGVAEVLGLPVRWTVRPPYSDPAMVAAHKARGRLPYLKGVTDGCEYDWASVPRYSTDIAAAWKVVEARPNGEWNWRLSQADDGRWWAEVRKGYCTSYKEACIGIADEPPLAICRAALQTAINP